MTERELISHDELKQAILEKYPLPFWFSLTEVKSATGFGWARSADVVAFGMYESRGHEIHAFECKASRADFLGEMRKPDKAEAIVGEVDKFWMVVPKGMVKKEELPATWGLITVKRKDDGSLYARVSKQASQMKRDTDVVGRGFCASMLFQALKVIKKYEEKSVLKEDIRGKMEAEYKHGFKLGKREVIGRDTEHRIAKLEKAIKEFEEASGIEIHEYYIHGNKNLGKAVRAVQAMENFEQCILGDLKATQRSVNRVCESIAEHVETFNDLSRDRKKKKRT